MSKDRERFASDDINDLGDFVNAIFPVKKCCQDKAQEIIVEIEDVILGVNCDHLLDGCLQNHSNYVFTDRCPWWQQLKQKWGIANESTR